MTAKSVMNDQERQQWLRQQYQTATKFLADKGLVTKSFSESDSRYVVPLVSVWKVNLIDNSSVWVIAGDLPSDSSPYNVASDAREALRHFALKWQLQAENILRTGTVDQKPYANILISRSEGLYDLVEKEELWETEVA